MIVKDSETKSYICPIMSFHHKQTHAAEPCRGKTCMAWRELRQDHGVCGLSHGTLVFTIDEDKQLYKLSKMENSDEV